MKYLVMCEGTNEETIINMFLKNGNNGINLFKKHKILM